MPPSPHADPASAPPLSPGVDPSPAAPPRPVRLRVVAWPDPVLDAVGHDPRSLYVERFWLPLLGPTATWLLRRLVAGLETTPVGFDLDLAEAARALGLGPRFGASTPFGKALVRVQKFGAVRAHGDEVGVRRRLAPLTRRQVARLGPALRDDHRLWQEEAVRTPESEARRLRARRLALSLLELGADRDETERQLHRWKYRPAQAADAVAWAWPKHEAAGVDTRRAEGAATSAC